MKNKIGVMSMKNKRCIALYSGGLDSILAIKMLQEQSIEVIAVYFCTPFFGMHALNDPEAFRGLQKEKYGITVHPTDFTSEIIEIVSNPKHGYGRHLNPCIDCKIGMLKKAKAMMESFDASFVVTGEVLGQRPMSQRKDSMSAILKETGLKDVLLRPLCAKYLLPTLPEREGWVDRELLGDISGRGRKSQKELASKYGLDLGRIPTPAGGCLLTHGQIARKVNSTFNHFKPDLPTPADIMLDIAGRKFNLDDKTVFVISRSEEENRTLTTMVQPGNVFMKTAEVPGPLCILRGDISDENLAKAAGICLRYGKARGMSGHDTLYGPDPFFLTQTVGAPVFSDDHCKLFQIDLNI